MGEGHHIFGTMATAGRVAEDRNRFRKDIEPYVLKTLEDILPEEELLL